MKNLTVMTAPRRFSAKCSQILADFKDRVATELANEFSALNERLIHQVVNEADAVAWTTLFPALILPALAGRGQPGGDQVQGARLSPEHMALIDRRARPDHAR